MFGHSSWDTSRTGFRAEARKSPNAQAQTRVFAATKGGVGYETREKPGSNVDCVVGSWSEWTLTGDGCNEIRTRNIKVRPKCNGRGCPDLEEKRSVAARDAVWKWDEWKDDPSDPCKQIRVRIVVTLSSCGGREYDPMFPPSDNDSNSEPPSITG